MDDNAIISTSTSPGYMDGDADALRLLVVDDDDSMARTLVDILQVKGFETRVAHSAPEALEHIGRSHFDCVLSDIRMPGANGVELHRAIKQAAPDLPVVLMTAYSSDSLVRQGLDEGVIGVLTKPLDIGMLLSFFSFLRQERSLVIVDDDPDFCQTLGEILVLRGFCVQAITDPHRALEDLAPDVGVILLDMRLNGFGGLDVLRKLRARHIDVPVLLVTGYGREMASAVEAAQELGAYACLYKPIALDELLVQVHEARWERLSSVLEDVGEHALYR